MKWWSSLAHPVIAIRPFEVLVITMQIHISTVNDIQNLKSQGFIEIAQHIETNSIGAGDAIYFYQIFKCQKDIIFLGIGKHVYRKVSPPPRRSRYPKFLPPYLSLLASHTSPNTPHHLSLISSFLQ